MMLSCGRRVRRTTAASRPARLAARICRNRARAHGGVIAAACTVPLTASAGGQRAARDLPLPRARPATGACFRAACAACSASLRRAFRAAGVARHRTVGLRRCAYLAVTQKARRGAMRLSAAPPGRGARAGARIRARRCCVVCDVDAGAHTPWRMDASPPEPRASLARASRSRVAHRLSRSSARLWAHPAAQGWCAPSRSASWPEHAPRRCCLSQSAKVACARVSRPHAATHAPQPRAIATACPSATAMRLSGVPAR